MQPKRDEMYFEPRCVSGCGTVRWYGETVEHEALYRHCFRTVYLRDSGPSLYIYEMLYDDHYYSDRPGVEIKTVMRLLCKVRKERGRYRYGCRMK